MSVQTNQREPVLGLAPGRMRALRAIAAFYHEHGWTPTTREIAAAMGIVSTNAVNDHLLSLERAGAISKPREKRSRAIVITPDGWRALRGIVNHDIPIITVQQSCFCYKCGAEYFGAGEYHGDNCKTPRVDSVAREALAGLRE